MCDRECSLMLAGLDQMVQPSFSTWHKALFMASNSRHTLHTEVIPVRDASLPASIAASCHHLLPQKDTTWTLWALMSCNNNKCQACYCRVWYHSPQWCTSCLFWKRRTAGQHWIYPAGSCQIAMMCCIFTCMLTMLCDSLHKASAIAGRSTITRVLPRAVC